MIISMFIDPMRIRTYLELNHLIVNMDLHLDLTMFLYSLRCTSFLTAFKS